MAPIEARPDTTNVTWRSGETAAACTAERLLRLPQVLGMVGLGKTTIYAMIKEGEFPQPRKVRKLSLWVETEVRAWIEKVIAPNGQG